jgi:hypothetical protein
LEELEEDETPATKWLFHWIMMGMGLQGTDLEQLEGPKDLWVEDRYEIRSTRCHNVCRAIRRTKLFDNKASFPVQLAWG